MECRTNKKQVRRTTFMRGVGADRRHITEGYTLSDLTKEKDAQAWPLMNTNSNRVWYYNKDMDLSQSQDSAAITWNGFGPFPSSRTVDGAETGHRFCLWEQAEANVREAAEKLAQFKGMDKLTVMMIRNEACNAYWMNGGGGFDPDTLAYFRTSWLPERFGCVEEMNRLAATTYESFDAVFQAPATERENRTLRYEHYLCMRYTYEECVRKTYDMMHAANPDLPIGMATFGQGADPYGSYARLDFLNTGASNLYECERRYLAGWAFDIDRNLATYAGKPFYITEMGKANNSDGWTQRSLYYVMRDIRQSIAIAFMRPQVHGTYWFNYGYMLEGIKGVWGLVDPEHNMTPLVHTLGDVYRDVESLDQAFSGVYSCPLVAVTDQQVDQIRDHVYDTDTLMNVLYAKGVTIRVVRMSDDRDLRALDMDKLILTDLTLSQNPDGSEDVSTALLNYLSQQGNEVLSLRCRLPRPLFGKGGLPAKTPDELQDKLPGFISRPVTGMENFREVWHVIAPFIHGEFIKGKVPLDTEETDSSVVRILDTYAFSDGTSFPEFTVQQQLVYGNRRVILCLVNTFNSIISDMALPAIDITLGINKKAGFHACADVLAAHGDVKASLTQQPRLPEWDVQDTDAIEYLTIRVQNLDTYAFIDIGGID